ncbi:hypothetical protein [Streptosporangium carneum]|nr:hypothetical protein [Streptosporangium carneum]
MRLSSRTFALVVTAAATAAALATVSPAHASDDPVPADESSAPTYVCDTVLHHYGSVLGRGHCDGPDGAVKEGEVVGEASLSDRQNPVHKYVCLFGGRTNLPDDVTLNGCPEAD